MADNNSTGGGGIGLFGALGIVFVVLKLVGVIAWPWLWVLAPFWAPFTVLGVGLIVGAVIYGVLKLSDKRTAKKARVSRWQGDA